METIVLSLKIHQGTYRIFAEFPYNKSLIAIIKTLPGATWSQSDKQWHFNLNKQVVKLLQAQLSGCAKLDLSLLKEQLKEKKFKQNEIKYSTIDSETSIALEYYKLWMEQKRYSPETIKNYLNQALQFFRYYQPRTYKELTVEDVEKYNHQVIIANNLSVSFQRGMVGAIKLFYNQCSNTKMDIEKLQRPFKESRLPEVLSKEEVQEIINATHNMKHKALLSIIYSCGLRIGEVISLKINDIDKGRKLIKIRLGKGKKTDMCLIRTSCAYCCENIMMHGNQKFIYLKGNMADNILKEVQQKFYNIQLQNAILKNV